MRAVERRRRRRRPLRPAPHHRCAQAIRSIPLDQAIELIQNARSIVNGAIDRRPGEEGDLLEEFVPAVGGNGLLLELEAQFLHAPADARAELVGLVSRAPASFTIVPRRGSRPPRSSSGISVRWSSQRKPSSSWEILFFCLALRRFMANRSRGSIDPDLRGLNTETLQTKHFTEPGGERRRGVRLGWRARPRASQSGCSGSRAQSPSAGPCPGPGPSPARG